MLIKALQKTTLIDYPGKIACTIFLHGCNFRCGFCHNPELVVNPVPTNYSQEEVLEFLEKRKGQLEGVCITGGESFFNMDFVFVRKIKEKGFLVKIDTNGSYPERLRMAIEEGIVDYIAMDIKASRENYEKVVSAKVLTEKIEESVRLISELPEYEFRTTVVNRFHTKEEFRKMMEWLGQLTGKKLKKFALQGFKNSGKLIDSDFNKEPNTEESYLNELKEIAKDYFEKVEVRG